MRDGKRLAPSPDVVAAKQNLVRRLAEMPGSVTTLDGAAPLPVRISPALDALARAAHHS
jgi:hypothetical protein